MLGTVTDTQNNGETVTVHNVATEKWSFNHRGVVTLAGVPEPGDHAELAAVLLADDAG